MLTFRDHLRRDPTDRQRYEATKRDLAARPWQSVQDYADAKSDIVAEIMSHAPSRPEGTATRAGSGAGGTAPVLGFDSWGPGW